MSATAYRSALVREIEQAMDRIDKFPNVLARDFQDGQLDAYAHILQLVKDETE